MKMCFDCIFYSLWETFLSDNTNNHESGVAVLVLYVFEDTIAQQESGHIDVFFMTHKTSID